MKDTLYYEYLAAELRDQRNAALDQVAEAKTDIRLLGATIASLETELFLVKDDLGKFANTLDHIMEHNDILTEYVSHLERNAGEAVAESQKRLRERIDVLEAENERLESLVDGTERPEFRPENQDVFLQDVFLTEAIAPEPAEIPEVGGIGPPGQGVVIGDQVFGNTEHSDSIQEILLESSGGIDDALRDLIEKHTKKDPNDI